MVTLIRKCGSVFYPSLLIFYEDQNQNKECLLTKYEQFSKCYFEETSI